MLATTSPPSAFTIFSVPLADGKQRADSQR
jgi:hypothetical protein